MYIFSCQWAMKQTVKDSVSIEKETFISSSSSPLRHYLRNMWNFVEPFAKM